MPDTLNELARRYFGAKLGDTTPGERVTNMQRRYWLGLLGGDTNTGLKSLEKDWLRKIINDNGGTPDGDYLSGLYIQAVAALGGAPTKYINSNTRQVYILDI